jgi:hypothetical protein
MTIHRLRHPLVVVSILVLLAIVVPLVKPTSAQTDIFTDFASFEAATGQLTEVNFEDLPASASSDPEEGEAFIPNSLTLDGVVFTDPFVLQAGFCSSQTCQPDPNNQAGGNIVLILNQGATIDLPVGTGGAMLVIEGMGDVPFSVRVTDFGGSSVTVDGQASLNDVEFLGFTSASGIQQIEVVSVGPTGDCPQPPCGPLVLSALFVELDDPDVTIGVWADSTGDVSPSNADIVFGLAIVSEGKVDLRVQFLDSPFLNGDAHDMTWCLDTDQSAATGDACGQAGADQEFTLSGELGSLFGGTFSFEGALSGLDPCSAGSFNWDTNTLRLVIPLELLSDNDTFNYAVEGVFQDKDENNNAQVHSDTAPDVIGFGSTNGFFTNVTGEFAPFNGTPLCSANRGASITIPVQTSGTIEFFPELGTLRKAPIGDMIQSYYFKTTSSNRQFLRGFFEFTVPAFPDDVQVSKATLILTESRARTSTPKPPVTHEVSYYQPADLIVNTDDYTRTTTLLPQTIETDANAPTQVFSMDVTDLLSALEEDTLGFRIKLAADPTHSAIDNFGSGFGEPSTIPPRILVRLSDAQADIDPAQGGTLVYTDTENLATKVLIPAGAVSETTTLVYEVVTTTNTTSSILMCTKDTSDSSGPVYIDRAFILDAYQGDKRQSGSIFQQPISITLHYTDTEVIGLNEDTLTLNYWNGARWEYTACGPYARHLDDNWLAIPICHLGEFALFGMSEEPVRVYLPVVLSCQ